MAATALRSQKRAAKEPLVSAMLNHPDVGLVYKQRPIP
jgi:hypothetical protein